jgi:hypothetical protein
MKKRTSSTYRLCKVFCFLLSFIVVIPLSAFAHGFAGQRFFPTTFAVDDPFVSDEFSLLYNQIQMPGDSGGPRVDTASLSTEVSKRITQRFGISVGGQYQSLHPAGEAAARGYGNLEVNAKYQFYTSAEHETLMSVGISDEIGNTGNKKVSESFSVISPTFYFGKGFGDLFDTSSFLRPLAVTGVLAWNVPTNPQTVTVNPDTGDTDIGRNPATLTWGLTVQYSFIYLQSFVKDIGLIAPFDRMVAVVEFPMETCLNRGCEHQTTGTVNPGITWIGKTMELGIAAQIPMNERSGEHIGVFGLLHFFIDDLFPKSIGRPVFP